MDYKQPRSIQVVIFARTPSPSVTAMAGNSFPNQGEAPRRPHSSTGELTYLLLRRVASHGAFWQSVTGSLEAEETHRQAAIREVLEETGINSREDELLDLDVVNTFEIAPQWRNKYAPGVTYNEEVCFALEVSEFKVVLDPIEHDAYEWKSYDQAMDQLYWDSNKRGLAATRLRVELSSGSRGQK